MTTYAFASNHMPEPDRWFLVQYITSDGDDAETSGYVHFEIAVLRHEAFGFALYRQDANDGYGKRVPNALASIIEASGYWQYLAKIAYDSEMDIGPSDFINGDPAQSIPDVCAPIDPEAPEAE